MRRFINLFGFIGTALFVAQTTAADFQSHKSIHDVAHSYMHDHVVSKFGQIPDIESGKLDSRLRLSQCTQALETYLPEGSRGYGNITVGVRCTDNNPWSLQVPIKVSLYKEVLVVKESLPRGKLLELGDLKQSTYNLASLSNGYISEYDQGVGMKLKRPITAGAVLTPRMIEKPKLILRGQRVTILAKTGGIVVRTSGKALANGVAGERIGVINIKSKRKMEGIVTLSGEVKVTI